MLEQAREDLQNLREKQDGTYTNQYREDLSRLGAFGDIYGSLTSLFASLAFIATGSALLIQIFLFYDQKMHQIAFDKRQKTFLFYDEFNNIEMFKVRVEADLYLRTTTLNLYEIAESCIYDHEDRGKGAGAIWPVIRFYQKLAKAVEYKQLDDEMTTNLFAEVFIWWYFVYLEDKLVMASTKNSKYFDVAWDAADDLMTFQVRLAKQCNDVETKTRYDRWVKAALAYKEKNRAQ